MPPHAFPPKDPASVHNRETLFAFLRARLDWPVDPQDPFTYELEIEKRRLEAKVSHLVPFGADDPHPILLVETSGEFRRRDLREALRQIRGKMRDESRFADRTIEDLIFIVASEGYADLRFCHFTERSGAQPKLSVFGWRPAELGDAKNTLEKYNLSALEMPPRNVLDEIDWSQARWEGAWDVDPVTTGFFDDYRNTFTEVERTIRADNPKVRTDWRLFTQRLFNRLLFIHFVSRKRRPDGTGWLEFDGRYDYLPALLEGAGEKESFYRDRLHFAFFGGLNLPPDRDNPELRRRRGRVPYLNGGLFEEFDATDRPSYVQIPNEVFETIIHGLFARWNFTVMESTPLDVDVAVDPEMLGKVFEELVTGRHETGSYYTPRPVVAFMCQEALKGYLAESGVSAGKIAALVDRHKPDDPTVGALSTPEARTLLERLLAVKVVDPACGSGAYLLGMLHDLFELAGVLEVRAETLSARDKYHRKLRIIQNCLYGVDVDEFAVNIARLRLWLSLAVEHEGETPEPLPNLDFKIERGDSLMAPNPTGDAGQTDARSSLIAQFVRAKRDYFDPEKRDKAAIRREVESIRADIASWARAGRTVEGFDWAVEFAEVFESHPEAVTLGGRLNVGPGGGQGELAAPVQPGGFDIVVMNPPYVRADAHFTHLQSDADRRDEVSRWLRYRVALLSSHVYSTLFEKWDLYVPFLERALQLLRPDGQVVVIVSDAYNTSKYAQRSHEFLLRSTRIERIDFCSEIPLFNASVRNTILRVRRQFPADTHLVRRVARSGNAPLAFDTGVRELPTLRQVGCARGMFRPDTGLTESESPTNSVPLGRLCYVSYGIAASSDEKLYPGEFVTEDLLAELPDTVHPKPYVEGKDLERWAVRRVRYLEWGTDRAPRKFRRRSFPELHEVAEKLLAARITGDRPRAVVALDCGQAYSNHTIVTIVPWHLLEGVVNRSIAKSAAYSYERNGGDREDRETLSRQYSLSYLAGVLNSSSAMTILHAGRRGKLDLYPEDWKQLPIPVAAERDQLPIARLVDKCVAARGQGCQETEAEIDLRVAFLYSRTDTQETFEEWQERRGAEAAAAARAVRGLVAQGESARLEFKQSLEAVDPDHPSFQRAPEGQRAQRIAEARKGVLHSALKTICAFLNADGGTLLLGVADDGAIPGIGPDLELIPRRPDADGFENKLRTIIADRFRPLPLGHVDVTFHAVDGKMVCRVDVRPDREVYHLDGSVYVRDGNRTVELTGPELTRWVARRAQSG